MKDLQKLLDRGTKDTNRMVHECISAAEYFCREGDFTASAEAWGLAATYCTAMAQGRMIDVGGIRPMAGDK
jgi:hypothetical protein